MGALSCDCMALIYCVNTEVHFGIYQERNIYDKSNANNANLSNGLQWRQNKTNMFPASTDMFKVSGTSLSRLFTYMNKRTLDELAPVPEY